jgi:hypothetical protein
VRTPTFNIEPKIINIVEENVTASVLSLSCKTKKAVKTALQKG